MTSHPYAATLRATLNGFPPTDSPRDRRARRSLQAALDSLDHGHSTGNSLDAARATLDRFFSEGSPTPAAPSRIYPGRGKARQESPRKAL